MPVNRLSKTGEMYGSKRHETNGTSPVAQVFVQQTVHCCAVHHVRLRTKYMF